MASALLKTANAFIDCFETLDAETFFSLKTPECQHIFAPASANLPPPRNRAEFSEHMSHLKAVMTGFPVYAKETFENEDKKEVVIWATSEARFHEELKDAAFTEEEWAYKGEYIFILQMDDSGERVKRVFEFLDSKGTDQLRRVMARAKENGDRKKESK